MTKQDKKQKSKVETDILVKFMDEEHGYCNPAKEYCVHRIKDVYKIIKIHKDDNYRYISINLMRGTY